jgi:hypothetical protein
MDVPHGLGPDPLVAHSLLMFSLLAAGHEYACVVGEGQSA